MNEWFFKSEEELRVYNRPDNSPVKFVSYFYMEKEILASAGHKAFWNKDFSSQPTLQLGMIIF